MSLRSLASALTCLCLCALASEQARAQGLASDSAAPEPAQSATTQAMGAPAAPLSPQGPEQLLLLECPGAAVLVWRARRRLERGDYLLALSTYSHAAMLDPGCGAALLELGRLRARLGDLSEAERLYTRAIRLRGSAAQAYKERAWLRRRQGHRESALSDLRAALTLSPADLQAREQLATWYIEVRAWAAALAEYRAVLRLLSDSSDRTSLEKARLKVSALAVMAAETDPVLLGHQHDSWIRRSMSRLDNP